MGNVITEKHGGLCQFDLNDALSIINMEKRIREFSRQALLLYECVGDEWLIFLM